MIQTLYTPFQKWSENCSIWLISDTHFDSYIGKYENVSNEQRIEIINKYVNKNDTLILLGDIGTPSYLSLLKTKKIIIIKGNHDVGTLNYKEYASEIYSGPLFIAEKLVLSHEPIYGLEDFALNIHGHIHNGTFYENNHINVAADVVDFKPINLKDIIKQGYLSKISTIHRLTIDRAGE